jgi:hypothetical protein
MTPVAAYYLFVANEQLRADADKYRVSGPSLRDRLRTFVVARRQKAPVARTSQVARPA